MTCAGLAMFLSLMTAPERRSSDKAVDFFLSDDYERGFVSGYRAFREQSEDYVPQEQYSPSVPAYSYSSYHWSELETRGYIDGYHKATAIQSCPANEAKTSERTFE